jgi:hypothetical protein
MKFGLTSRALLGAALLTAFVGCAATKIETRWRDPEAQLSDLAFRNVIAIAQIEDAATRREAEDEMVRVLLARPTARARGMQVLPSYSLIPEAELGDVEKLRAKVEAEGFDGAVVMRLIADQERVTYVPGRYESSWSRVVTYDPGYTRVDRVVRVETSVYSITKGERLWSGVTRTLNPADLPELIDEVAAAVGTELTAQGLRP